MPHMLRACCAGQLAAWPAGELVCYECYIASVGLRVHKLLTDLTPLTLGFFLIRLVYEILLAYVFVIWWTQSFWSRLEFVIMAVWKPNNLCNTCFVKLWGYGAGSVRGGGINVVPKVHSPDQAGWAVEDTNILLLLVPPSIGISFPASIWFHVSCLSVASELSPRYRVFLEKLTVSGW